MDLTRYVRAADEFQRRRPFVAFPVAVVKKFGDDQGGDLAALVAYYGFLSMFPLLLVLFTTLGFVLQGHPDLQDSVRTSALANFPIIGDQLSRNVTSVRGSGVGLAIGIVAALWGGLGIANAAQNVMNRVWEVPVKERPGFPARIGRSAVVLATVGVGIIATSLLSGFGSGSGGIGFALRAAVFLGSIVVNIGLFILAFRILTVRDVGWHDVVPGAVFAAVAWVVLQAIGGFYVTRTLVADQLTAGDRRAYVESARTEERHPREQIDVTIESERSPG
jgi:YihY family inner membrane protein